MPVSKHPSVQACPATGGVMSLIKPVSYLSRSPLAYREDPTVRELRRRLCGSAHANSPLGDRGYDTHPDERLALCGLAFNRLPYINKTKLVC